MKYETHCPINEHVLRYIMLNEAERFIANEMSNIPHVSGDEIVDCRDTISFGEELITEVRAEKARSSGNDCVLLFSR